MTGGQPGSRGVREIAAEIRQLASLVGVPAAGHQAGPHVNDDRAGIDSMIGQVLEAIIADLVEGGAPERTQVSTQISEAASRAASLAARWSQQCARLNTQQRARVASSLTRLRSCRDQVELFGRICPEAARAFDIDRLMLAFVHDGEWSPWERYDARRRRDGALHRLDGPSKPLHELPVECRAVESRESVWIGETEIESGVLGYMQDPLTAPVLVAPLVAGDDVLALLYLALPSRWAWCAHDVRPRIDQFVAAVGRMCERAILDRRLRMQGARVQESVDAVHRITAALATDVELVRLVGRDRADAISAIGQPLADLRSELDDKLSTRERDVMAMLLTGQDNASIGQQLAIAPNTVKSHVRSILRKVGAVSRAELIARYYGLTTDRAKPSARSRSSTMRAHNV